MRGGRRDPVAEVVSERWDADDDDFDTYLEHRLADPEFRAAYEDAKARSDLLRRFVARRKVRSISQAAVAAQMGTTQSAVSDLEAGSTDPRLSTLQRYARAIGCRLDVRFTDGWHQWEDAGGRGGLKIRPVQFEEVGRAAEEISSTYGRYKVQLLVTSEPVGHRVIQFAGRDANVGE